MKLEYTANFSDARGTHKKGQTGHHSPRRTSELIAQGLAKPYKARRNRRPPQ